MVGVAEKTETAITSGFLSNQLAGFPPRTLASTAVPLERPIAAAIRELHGLQTHRKVEPFTSGDGRSGSSVNSSESVRAPVPEIHSHDDYRNASDAERLRWAKEKSEQLQRAGFDKGTGKGLKEGLDAFYSDK